MLLKDKYGLEFPWQPRSLLRLLPKPTRRAAARFARAARNRLLQVLAGALQSLAPRKLLAEIHASARKIIDAIKEKYLVKENIKKDQVPF